MQKGDRVRDTLTKDTGTVVGVMVQPQAYPLVYAVELDNGLHVGIPQNEVDVIEEVCQECKWYLTRVQRAIKSNDCHAEVAAYAEALVRHAKDKRCSGHRV